MHFQIVSYTFLCIFHYINVSGNRKTNKINLEKIWNNFFPLISKIDKSWYNLIEKYSLEKPYYLENRVVRKPWKWRTASILNFLSCEQNQEYNVITVTYKSLFVTPTNQCILTLSFVIKTYLFLNPIFLLCSNI